MVNRNLIEQKIKDMSKASESLVVFFYVPDTKQLENIIPFLQKYEMSVKRCIRNNSHPLFDYFQKNTNYVAQSKKAISPTNFEILQLFLCSKLIGVTFFYQNKFWNKTRLEKNFSLYPLKKTWTQFPKIWF